MSNRKVLCYEKVILSVGARDYALDDDPIKAAKYKIFDLKDFGWIRDKRKFELENDNGKAKLKIPR